MGEHEPRKRSRGVTICRSCQESWPCELARGRARIKGLEEERGRYRTALELLRDGLVTDSDEEWCPTCSEIVKIKRGPCGELRCRTCKSSLGEYRYDAWEEWVVERALAGEVDGG